MYTELFGLICQPTYLDVVWNHSSSYLLHERNAMATARLAGLEKELKRTSIQFQVSLLSVLQGHSRQHYL